MLYSIENAARFRCVRVDKTELAFQGWQAGRKRMPERQISQESGGILD